MIKTYSCGTSTQVKPSDFLPALKKFDHLVTPSEPGDADFLFVHERPKSLREMFSIADRGQIRVFFGREAISPDMNLFDYALTFDSTIRGERVFRPHTLLTFENDLAAGDLNFGHQLTYKDFMSRKHLCDFIYRNSLGHPMRQRLFFELSREFNDVRSYGAYLKNSKAADLPLEDTTNLADWRSEKIAIQKHHKFSLAIENASFWGYTSEKILTALMAGSIPIYWGNPIVEEEFNPKRFIKFNGEDFSQLAETIVNLLDSPEELVEMLSQPAMTEKQLEDLARNETGLLSWFSELFTQPVSQLRRRPKGWFPDWYAGMIGNAYKRQKFSRARWASYLKAKISPSHA
jgi:alpha(1,3/1,4) fucosyltransferase